MLLEQLLFEPEWDCHAKGAKAFGRKGHVGFEQALELEERLIVEHDMIDVAERDLALLQAIGERMMREPGIVSLAAKALLLGGSDDVPIDNKRCCTVVIECRQPKNPHAPVLKDTRRASK